MEAIAYTLLVIAIAWVIVWFYMNDRKAPGEPTDGLFAMRQERAQDQPEAARRSRSRRNVRR